MARQDGLYSSGVGAVGKPIAVATTFAIQQLVRWSEAGRSFGDGFFVRQFGEGPFSVSSILPVKTNCESPGLCRGGKHHVVCAFRRAEVINHPQLIELGALQSPIDGYPLRLSGKFLRAA